MPKPWKGFGPTPDEIYYKKWQELGPEANVADLYAYTDTELAKYEEQYADYIRRGISSAVHRKHPTLAYALKTLAGVGELPPVAALTRSAGTAVEKLFNAPGYAAEVSPTGQPVTTGIPWLDTGADVAGNLAATLAQYAIAAGLTKGAGGVLSKIPQLSRAAQLAPTAAKAAAEGAATGAAYTGLEALKGVPVTAKDLVTHAAFAGGAGLGGTLTRQAVAALKPGMKVLPEAVLTGTGAGLGAAAALYPFSDKKGLEYAKEAGINVATMALLHTGLAMIQPVRPEADFFNKTRAVVRSWADGVKAAKAGDKNLLQAKYREYWENINAAYHAGRRIKTDSPTKLPIEARIRFEEAWRKATTPEMKNVTPRSAAPPPTVTEATPTVSSPAPAPPAGAVAPPVPIETPIKPPVPIKTPAVQELSHTLAKALQQLTRTGSARINQTDLKIVPVGEGYGIEVVTGGNRQMHLAAPDTPYTDLAEANKAAVVKLRELALAPPAIQQQEPDIQQPSPAIQHPIVKGATVEAKTEQGTKITARYAVVDAEDLIASHTLGLGVNPAYPQELQPRDRTRVASEAQISRIVNTLDPDFLGESPKASEGAPIIGPDRIVESGNARIIALQRSYAYNTPGAKAYRQWLVDNAEKFGLKPEDINVPNPVLVRIRQTDVDRASFAREANIQSTAAMSATEQAMADARQLTSGLMSRFMPTDEGEILNASNRDFIRSFMRDVVGPTEQARYITPDGSLSQEGLNRIRNAVFAKAYGNPAVLEKLAESTDSNVRNVTSAMLIAAPRYADIQERIRVGALHPLALTEEIGMATNKLASLREQGMSLETYLAQMQLFSDDMTPEAVRLLQAIQKYSRSRKKLAELFLATADAVEAVGMPGQEALFGGNVIPTKAEILEAAILKVEKKYEPIQQTGALFEGEAAGSAVAPQTDATARIVQEPKLEPTGTSTLASAGGYAPTPPPKEPLNPVELPELVELAREINAGKVPSVYKKLRAMHGQALGQFQVRGDEGRIALRADIFLGQEIASGTAKPMDAETRRKAMDEFRLQVAEKQGLNPEDLITTYEYDKNRHKLIFRVYRPDPTLAPKVLAHEIGHLVDWLPDHILKRGNILGHLAALKKWLKTTIGQLPETPDKFLTAETRQRLQKEARQSAGEDKEAYAALYKQLLDKHIQEQKLVTKDEIMEELKNLTQQWKPFDVNANTEYTKYRYSPEELYADAISVLFNAPEIIEMTAPKFLDMLNAYSVRRPAVKQALETIQSRYTNREAVVQHRLDAMYSMVERGSKKFSELSTPQRRETTLIDTLAKGLIDVHHPILKGVRQREKQKNFAEQARQARYLLEEMTYISSSINDYVYQNERQVRQVLEKAGATLNDLDVYLIHKRVMDRSDRATLANPLGTTPQSAAEGLKALRQRLGPEKYAAVELAAQNYRKLREEYIFPELEKSRFYSPETLQMLKERTNYAKFAVVDYMEQKYGKQVTAKIYQQFGTLKDIAGPYAPTVVQDMAMLRAAKINDAKRAVIADLRNANAVQPAERKYSRDAGTMIAVEPKDPELGLIIVMEDGKPTGYYVDKEIAQSFEFNPAQTILAIPLWRAVNGALRDLFVGKNPIWQARNIFKDFSGTVIKLPQMRLRDVPKLVSLYKTAAKEVIAEVFRGERSKDISAALREYALPATRIYSTHDTTFDNELDRLVTEFLQPMLAEPSTPFAKKQWLRFMTFLHRMGQGSEMLGNLAGYKYLKKYHPKISIPERAHIVRNLVSTPPHKRHGAWHAFTNNVALFSNIGKEGIRTSIESFQTNPTRYAWKLTMLNIMPKLILKGAQLALAGTAFATLCDKISRYDKRMYTVIPLGLVNNGQDALYIRVPTDYEGQVIGAAVYDILEGRIFGTEGALRSLSNINPYQLNPLLDTAYKAFQIAVLGLNPIDEFYGSPILSEQGFTAGGLPAAKEFGAYAWNSLGGNLLYRMPSGPELIQDESTLQKLLRMPGFNIIGTFLRVSRNGEMSKVYDIKAQARKDAAQEQIARREEIIRAVNEGLDATQTYQRLAAKKLINPGKTSLNEFKRTYNTYKARQSGDPWDIGIETATSVEERRRIFAAMPEEKRKQYAPIYNLKTGEKW